MSKDRFDEVLTTPMSDTAMDLYPDFMCIPTIANDPFRFEGETYAQALRGYIEFVLSDDKIDPMDEGVIY